MKKHKNIIIIILMNLFIILITTKTNIFGSTMDFLSQHIIFPEYLRNTFYETGNLIPKLALNLGAGQNIYNIAYYGLLNPIIILSYFFPFIKMIDYIIIINIILLIISNILFYQFIKEKEFNKRTKMIITFLFMFSGPLLFHFHRHFMFINYMPFLILSLIHIDKNKEKILILDILLIITTSFYYSIPSIITILIYYFYKNMNNLQPKKILNLFIYILTPILISMILLLPTLNTLLVNRKNTTTNIINLLIPNINIDNLLYGAYSPGLTSILIISLIYLIISKKKNNIFLVATISLLSFIPLFLYLLNGGLYTRSKALIPLLPILILVIGIFIDDLFKNKIDIKKLILTTIIINLIILIKYKTLIYYIDLLFMIILILIYKRKRIKEIITIPLFLLTITICILLNKTENFINKDYYKEVSKQEETINTNYRTINLNNSGETINKIYSNNFYTTSMYSSTINKYYSNLYHNIFKINNRNINTLMIEATDNILFNKYLGVKYIISDNKLDYPYNQIKENIYELETYPIAYATNNLVNKEYYNSLYYPYNLEILTNYIIDEKSNNKPNSNVKEINLNYTSEIGKNIKIEKTNNKIIINVKEDDEIILNLKNNLQDKILFINIYGLEENEKDIKMTINNQTNLLTNKDWIYPNHNNDFYFTLNNVKDKLEIKLSKGIYTIESIKTYVLEKEKINDLKEVDKLNIEKINPEIIKGKINVTNDGYFILKMPYDKGFNIEVNNKKQEYELINNSFIGFKINKGNYDIKITYEPKLYKEGKTITVIGLIILISMVLKKIILKKEKNSCILNVIR